MEVDQQGFREEEGDRVQDSGEFLAVGVEDTVHKLRGLEKDNRIEELERGLVDVISKVHSYFHLPNDKLQGARRGERRLWQDCNATTCRMVQQLLRLKPFD